MVTQSIPLVADLRTQNRNIGTIYLATGLVTEGDTGGGIYFWNPASTNADDGFYYIQVTGVATGRWVRIYAGSNIYNTDGSLLDNRDVTLNGSYLSFIGSSSTTKFNADGSVTVGSLSGVSSRIVVANAIGTLGTQAFVPGTTIRFVEKFTTTAGQTIFNTVNTLYNDLFDVFLNGVKLNDDSFNYTANQIVLDDASYVGDIIDVIGFSSATVYATLPSQVGNAGKYLTTDGTNLSWAAITGGFVPYTGATATVDLGDNDLEAGSVFVEGASGAGGALRIKQFASSAANLDGYSTISTLNTGVFYFTAATTSPNFKNFVLNPSGLTDNTLRTYTLPNLSGTLALLSDITPGLTSVGLSMPSAFAVSNSPLTSNGTIAVTGAGTSSQYVRGDGQLANFPTNGGGGSSVNYYLNGSVTQGTFGGDTYYEMSKTPVLGAGTNFTRTNAQGNGYIASFITDAGDPSLLNIPGGNWNIEFYFQSSASGGSPQFYGEIYKVDALNNFTLVASGSTNPEGITNGTIVDQYFTSIPVPQTSLLVTDRLAIRIYVITSGRTITLHTEDGNLCEVLTTFSTGLNALNGLTAQVQYFATGTSGTDFAISSATDTHTFNLPTASATNRGALSSADWSTFSGKVGGSGVTGQVAYWNGTGSQTGSNNLFWDAANSRLGIGTNTPAYRLDANGNARINGTLNINNGNGLLINHILNATTNGDQQTGLGINVSFSDASFTGVNHYALQIAGSGYSQLTANVGQFNLPTNGFGLQVGWNKSNGGGETSLWYNKSAGSTGGLYIGENVSGTGTYYSRWFSGTGNLLLQNGGTFTDSGQRLQVQGTTLLAGAVTMNGSVTGTGNTSNYTVTASSNLARSKAIISTLISLANNDTLIGLDINPTFSTGSFTGINRLSLRSNGISIFGNSATGTASGRADLGVTINSFIDNSAIAVTSQTGNSFHIENTAQLNNVYANFSMRVDNGGNGLYSNIVLFKSAASTGSLRTYIQGSHYMSLFSTGNLLLQNGGTHTDAGFRLDVNGTARYSGRITSTVTNDSALVIQSSGFLTLGESGQNIMSASAALLIGGGTTGLGIRYTIGVVIGNGGVGYHYLTDNYALFSTQTGAVNLSSGIPASAVLEARSTTKGFLPPRMTNAQRTAISSPAVGLIVYCTDATEGLYQYINNAWVNLTGVVTNRQTASYTLALGDSNDLVEMNVATANNLTVPLNSSVTFPIGTKIDIAQYGAGQTTVVATGGVTVRSAGGALKLAVQYSGATLVKIGTDEWYLFGDITV